MRYTAPSTAATHTYDAAGQRTRSVVTAAGKTTTTEWTYEGIRLLGLTASMSDGAIWSVDYLSDERGTVFAGVYAASDATATPFMLETTDRGDVRELLDAAGRPFAYYGFDAFGARPSTATSFTASIDTSLAVDITTRQPLRYAGYAYDSESGLYYCSARYYDPAVGAFISKDPARADGEESAYQYCGGDPVGRVDPSGLATYLSIFSKAGKLNPSPHKWLDDVKNNRFRDLGHSWITISLVRLTKESCSDR